MDPRIAAVLELLKGKIAEYERSGDEPWAYRLRDAHDAIAHEFRKDPAGRAPSPMILTGSNEVLVMDRDMIDARGVPLRVFGGPYDGSIRLTPALLRDLAELALWTADAIEA
jgi:hypothetical protein